MSERAVQEWAETNSAVIQLTRLANELEAYMPHPLDTAGKLEGINLAVKRIRERIRELERRL